MFARRLRVLAAILLMLVAAKTAGAVDVIGTVTDSITGLPVTNVSVVILGTSDSTVTDAQGKYVFLAVPAGTYTFMIGRSTYQPKFLRSIGVGVPTYSCGDANGDETVNVGDAVYIINYVFKDGQAPTPLPAGDANCDGTINVGDAVHIINYIFKGGLPPCCP